MKPDDPVFGITYSQLDFPWQRSGEEAGLEHVRFKDLRAVCSQYAERAGIPQTVIVAAMGHGDEAMTRRYQRHRATMTHGQAAALEREIFARAS